MMEARLSALFKSAEEYEVLDKFKGEALKGKTYLPLFPYFTNVSTQTFQEKCFSNLSFSFTAQK